VLAQQLLLGRKTENPEVSPALQASAFPWECVAGLLWEDPDCGISLVCLRKNLWVYLQAKSHAGLTLRVP